MPQNRNWGITHAHFIRMGGLTVVHPSYGRTRMVPFTVLALASAGFVRPSDFPEEDIQDKSKGSWITKTVACIQIAWFLAQLVGRAAAKLPTSTLEMFTLAIVICTLISYGFWWDKPLDVSQPIIFNLTDRALGFLEGTEDLPNWGGVRRPDWMDDDHAWDSRRRMNLGGRKFRDANRGIALFIVIVVHLFGVCHLVVWNWSFPSAIERLLWRVSSVGCIILPLIFSISIFAFHQRGSGWLMAWTVIPLYVLFRVYMIIEIFFGLRSTPQGVYAGVPWSQWLPHL
jgi:hypothetical protein